MKLSSLPVDSIGYAPPETPTRRDLHEIRERRRRLERSFRGWSTRNRFPLYCLK